MAQTRTPGGLELLALLLPMEAAALWLADAGVLGSRAARSLGVALCCAAVLRRRDPRLRLLLLAAAVALASAAVLAARLEQAGDDRPRAVGSRIVEGRVLAAERRADWIRLDLRQVVAADGGPAPPRTLQLQGAAGEALALLEPGDRLRARVTLEPAAPQRNPGGPDLARILARRGIAAIGRPVDPQLVVREIDGRGARSLRHGIAALRTRAGERLSQEGQGGALLRALACGARGGLSAESRHAFAELGLAHLLSVSGLHLLLVAGFAFAGASRGLRVLAGLTPGRDLRRPALALAVAAAAAYALFSGFEVPVQRALCMVAAGAVALSRRRPIRGRSALLAAAALVLAAAPEALFEAGAQMSFAASAALLGLRREPSAPPPGAGRGARLVAHAKELLSVSAAAGAATAPLAATHLGVLSPAGLLANLLFVPVTGLVLLPAALLSALAALLAEAADGCLAAAGAGLVALCARLADLVCVSVAAAAAWLPDARPVAAPRVSVLAASALLAVAAVRAPGLSRRVVACLAATLLLALAPPPSLSPGAPRAVFLDVGQGDATLVQGRRGTLLVDAGLATPQGLDLGRSVVLPALAALGAERLDVLAVTHADADHAGGAAAILDAWPVGAVWLPAGAEGDPGFDGVRARARAQGVALRRISAATPPQQVGDLRVTPLAPAPGPSRLRGNDGSLVLQVEVAGRRILLPGDLEAAGEAQLLRGAADLASDVLKLAHHGSRTSTTPRLLAGAAPRLAVVSAACGGRFAMPHPEIVARLEAAGVPWAWTGRDGALLVGLEGDFVLRRFRREPADCLPGIRRGAAPLQRPTKRGLRFSTKARCPSRASSVRRSGRPSSSWRG